MSTEALAQHVGRPPARVDARGRARYLYVCAFADTAKVGVTCDPGGRFAALRRQAGPMESAHLALLSERDARLREGAVALALGGPTGTKGRGSEWFDVTRLDEALAIARTPQPLGRRYARRRQASLKRAA